jgi:hypothetical protein
LLRRGIGLLLGHPCARVSAVSTLLMAVLRVPAILVVLLLLVSLLVSLLSVCGVRVEALALLGLPRLLLLLLLLLRTRDKGLLARSELECARVEAGRAGHAGGEVCVV